MEKEKHQNSGLPANKRESKEIRWRIFWLFQLQQTNCAPAASCSGLLPGRLSGFVLFGVDLNHIKRTAHKATATRAVFRADAKNTCGRCTARGCFVALGEGGKEPASLVYKAIQGNGAHVKAQGGVRVQNKNLLKNYIVNVRYSVK